MTTEQQTNNGSKNWATAGILISWATFWMFLFSPFGFLIWLGILIYLIIKRSKLKWYLILSAWIFVPGCNFVIGTVRYFTGTAFLQSVGGPQTFHGIDRETRVVSTSSGCIFIGFEPFVFPANNAAVRFWTNVFGFQSGSYSGVFPTEDEAQESIKSADTIIVKRVDNFLQFQVAGETVKVDTSDLFRYSRSSILVDTVVGKILKNECFMFQRIDTETEMRRKAIYIVDIRQSRLLATYFDHY